jgi:hypothetical protein
MMTPEWQTVMTLALMVLAWVWGIREGRIKGHGEGMLEGIGTTIDTLHQMGMIDLDDEQNGMVIDLDNDVKVKLKKEDDE